MRKGIPVLHCSTFIPLLLISGLAVAEETPETYSVLSVQSAGSGCPEQQLESEFADANTLSINLISGMEVTSSPEGPISSTRKNCLMVIDIDYPNNWQYALVSATLAGEASIAPSAVAVHKISAHYQGYSTDMIAQLTLSDKEDVTYNESIEFQPEEWSPCGRKRHLVKNIQTRIRGTDDLSYIRSQPQTEIQLKWKRC